MYEELVKDLRDTAAWVGRFARLMDRTPDDAHAPLMRKAADAIEELTREYESVSKDFVGSVELCRKLEKPKWIPVTERLPGREWVLCKFRANIHEVLSLRDGYWYHDPQHQYMSGFVTNWMPLPELPTEVRA